MTAPDPWIEVRDIVLDNHITGGPKPMRSGRAIQEHSAAVMRDVDAGAETNGAAEREGIGGTFAGCPRHQQVAVFDPWQHLHFAVVPQPHFEPGHHVRVVADRLAVDP